MIAAVAARIFGRKLAHLPDKLYAGGFRIVRHHTPIGLFVHFIRLGIVRMDIRPVAWRQIDVQPVAVRTIDKVVYVLPKPLRYDVIILQPDFDSGKTVMRKL